ncbi:MAG: TRAP transporter small permease subunit [Candidatus Moduliflexus flocculans]|nr:TRAP transporter small permease subunit [Candidatus Moduliflexus flocculans]
MNDSYFKMITSAGVQVYTPNAKERQAFIDACAPVYDFFVTKGLFTEGDLDAMRKVDSRSSKRPAGSRHGARPAARAAGRAVINPATPRYSTVWTIAPPRALNALVRFPDKVLGGSCRVPSVGLRAAGVIISVFLRCVFGVSFAWAEELMTMVFIATTFFGAALGLREGEHIAISLPSEGHLLRRRILLVPGDARDRRGLRVRVPVFPRLDRQGRQGSCPPLRASRTGFFLAPSFRFPSGSRSSTPSSNSSRSSPGSTPRRPSPGSTARRERIRPGVWRVNLAMMFLVLILLLAHSGPPDSLLGRRSRDRVHMILRDPVFHRLTMPRRIWSGTNNFIIIAMPLFMLAGRPWRTAAGCTRSA